MRRKRMTVLLSGLTISLSLVWTVGAERPRQGDGVMPRVLYTTLSIHDPAYPTFVAADAAVREDGTIDRGLMHPHTVATLRSILDQPAERGCIRTEEVWWDAMGVPERPTLEAAAQRSQLVVVGKVVGKEFGFHFFEAGQLIEVEVEESLRGSARESYFAFLPVGDFEAGPYEICKIDRGYAEPPAVGQRVVLLVPKVENFHEPYVDLVDGAGLIVLDDESGSVELPKVFREAPENERLHPAQLLTVLRTSIGALLPEVR